MRLEEKKLKQKAAALLVTQDTDFARRNQWQKKKRKFIVLTTRMHEMVSCFARQLRALYRPRL